MRFRPEIDYYEILQVHPRASQEMIKKAYRTLMGEMGAHPDLGGDEERAKLINEAYSVLGEPELRAGYDTARQSRVRSYGQPGAAPLELERLAGFVSRVLLSAIVVVVGLMIARLLKNPALDFADLLGMVIVLLRIWGQFAPPRSR